LAASEPFEKEIEAFEAADKTQPPPRDAVLFIGSSTFRYWKSLPEDFPGIAVINRGFGGSQIADATRYADRIAIPYHPRHVVMYAGDNDIAAGKKPLEVLDEFQQFVKKMRSGLPDVPISYVSIKPSIARWKLIDRIKDANALIEQYTHGEKNVDFINVFPLLLGPDGKPRPELFRPDGLHMNSKGYALWIPVLTARLNDK
jgi:lysophospholipase L1-like esterase